MLDRINRIFKDEDFVEIFKGSSVSFLLRFGGLFIGYILTLLIANLFGAKGLGEYILAITVLELFTLCAKLGFDTTSIRFIASYAIKNKWNSIFHLRRKMLAVLSVSSLLASCLMYYFSDLLSVLLSTNASYIQLSSFFILPLSFFVLHYQSLRGLKRIAEFSFFYRMSRGLFAVISITILYQFNQSKDIALYSYLISILIVSILSFLSFRYWLNIRSKNKQSAVLEVMKYSTLFKISIPLMFAQSVQFIMAWTDKLMLGYFTDSTEVGLYHTAFKLSMFAAIALMSINSIASPKFAEMFAKQDMQGLKKVVQQSTKMIFWSTLPLVFIFFIFPEFLLGLFGEEFKVAVITFIILSFGRLISSFCGSVGNILQMTGYQKEFALILFCAATLNVLLNIMLIPERNFFGINGLDGINGAALASMSSMIFWNISMVFVVKKKLGFYTFYIPFIKK
tara:strand:- start:424 stop:1779 length:1356 start_codon:yes stop_codon:yes gene_type:complete